MISRTKSALVRGVMQTTLLSSALILGGFAQTVSASKVKASGSSDKSSPKSKSMTSDATAAGKWDPSLYRIGIEDELGISVWHESDLSTTAVVRPDGMITLPLLNDVKVTGMTTKELQDMLTERLKEFVKEPQVTVIARQIRSRRVYLLGEVVRPGTYPLNNSKTVLQLLAEAGGPGAFAKVGSIYVIRQQNGTRQHISFHYKRAMSGKNAADDIVLEPGDMIVVP